MAIKVLKKEKGKSPKIILQLFRIDNFTGCCARFQLINDALFILKIYYKYLPAHPLNISSLIT